MLKNMVVGGRGFGQGNPTTKMVIIEIFRKPNVTT